MYAGSIAQSRVTMLFDYLRIGVEAKEELVAKGEQQIACMQREGDRMVPAPVPPRFREALRLYAET